MFKWIEKCGCIASIVMLFLVLAALVIFALAIKLEAIYLCVLLAVSVIALVITFAVAAYVFKSLDLASPNHSLGLPDGSVRAVIALSLILIFMISSVFIYTRVAFSAQTRIDLSEAEYNNLSKESVVFSQPYNPYNATNETRYTVGLERERTDESVDIAKQIITTISTLVVAVSAFYFGAAKPGEQKENEDKTTKKLKDFKGFINTINIMEKDGKLDSTKSGELRDEVDRMIIESIQESEG